MFLKVPKELPISTWMNLLDIFTYIYLMYFPISLPLIEKIERSLSFSNGVKDND